jgi:phenylacetyl-CoA:acceptor oxidoreductase subunit 2
MTFGPNPWQQYHWDWRAATNFMAGGVGSGLIVCAALAGPQPGALVLGAVVIVVGLFAVWLELGRPWRAVNVTRHAATSWMTREAMVAPLLFAAVGAAWLGLPAAHWAAAVFALAFVYCQGRMLHASKGIPAWRVPQLVPLIIATGLAEGLGLWLLWNAAAGAVPVAAWWAFALLLVVRVALWFAWRRRVHAAAAALAAIDAAGTVFKLLSALALAAALVAIVVPLGDVGLRALQAIAGVLALAGGLWFKYTLVTRGGFNQGFALPHLPVRGVARKQEAP